jgi:Spy/CpxP family protein refolding chaperone
MKRTLAVMTLALCATAVMAQQAPPAPQLEDDAVLMAQGGPAPEAMPRPEADPQGPEGPRGFEHRGPGGPGGGMMEHRGPMKFWTNSEIATKLNLTDQQKQQLETTVTNYRLKLIDQRAAVQREEVRLEPLVQADKLDEGAISKQIDALISARGQLERTTAMMGVDIRKVLSTDQWKQLKEMRHGMMGMHGGDREKMREDHRGRRQGGEQAPPPPGDQNSPK